MFYSIKNTWYMWRKFFYSLELARIYLINTISLNNVQRMLSGFMGQDSNNCNCLGLSLTTIFRAGGILLLTLCRIANAW